MKKFLFLLLTLSLIYSDANAFTWSVGVPKDAIILNDVDIIGDNITAAQCRSGITITNDGKGGASDYNLPAGIEGMVATIYAEEAEVMTIDLINAGDVIVLQTGALAAGNAMDSDGNAYTEITLVCHEGTGAGDGVWYARSQVGVWADGGAD